MTVCKSLIWPSWVHYRRKASSCYPVIHYTHAQSPVFIMVCTSLASSLFHVHVLSSQCRLCLQLVPLTITANYSNNTLLSYLRYFFNWWSLISNILTYRRFFHVLVLICKGNKWRTQQKIKNPILYLEPHRWLLYANNSFTLKFTSRNWDFIMSSSQRTGEFKWQQICDSIKGSKK